MTKYRPSRLINLPERVLILCEGESEKIYLSGYKNEDANRRRLSRVEIEIYQPNDFSPLGLLKEARRKLKEAKKDRYPYKSIWIVFDRDQHANIPQTMHEANASDPVINVAFSLVCFEYWILLHFERSRKMYNNCEQIKKVIEKNHLPNYAKTMNFYPLINGAIDTALQNAEWLHRQNQSDIDNGIAINNLQAYTSFDRLIRYLEEIKNE
jgi:hypothetical protein